MAWWRPEEEASPQSRVGAKSRPVEPGEARGAPEAQPPQHQPLATSEPFESPIHAHPPLPRRRIPFNGAMVFFALVFVAVMVLPFVFAFGVFFNDDSVREGFDSDSHDGPSLIPAKRFGPALEKVRREAGSEASLAALRIAPERVDATVRQSGGRQVLIQVLPDLSTRRFNAGANSHRGLSFRRVDPRVPSRLVSAAAERLRIDPDDVSYIVLAATPTFGGGGVWSAYFQGGGISRYVIADLDGRNVRVPGE